MDNTSINVTNTTDLISVPAGEFRIFGNELATLSNDNAPILENLVSLYPNPANKSFQINAKTSDLIIYNLLGKVVAEFKGNYNENNSFSIENLERGIYIVKAETNKGNLIKRFIKE
jgi:hypothetical protein